MHKRTLRVLRRVHLRPPRHARAKYQMHKRTLRALRRARLCPPRHARAKYQMYKRTLMDGHRTPRTPTGRTRTARPSTPRPRRTLTRKGADGPDLGRFFPPHHATFASFIAIEVTHTFVTTSKVVLLYIQCTPSHVASHVKSLRPRQRALGTFWQLRRAKVAPSQLLVARLSLSGPGLGARTTRGSRDEPNRRAPDVYKAAGHAA